jgi:cytochrome c-type biogenesis protein CcmH
MLLWILMAVLTAAASLSVLVPLYRARPAAARASPDASIYKDQLGELDRDVGRGLIGAKEAAAARTEIARRLLRADASAAPMHQPSPEGRRRWAALAAIVAVPVVAVGLYLFLGSPQLPDQPLAARINTPPDQQDMAALIARVETHLASHPEDGRGWELLGPVYLRLGRVGDAQTAFSNAIRILGSTAERQASLGEAMVRANDGVVTAEARAAFERAAALDTDALRPRFFLALALSQEGKKEEALAAWRSLLKEAPAAGAPWVDIARRAVADLEGPKAAGPDADDVAAASKMTPEERTAMISGMVGSLAAKLDASPNDPNGWARLIRSYVVLGRPDDARSALAKARTVLAGDADGLALVEAEAKARGLTE